MPELLQVMDKLERDIFWRPRPDLPLRERLYRFAEGPIALKELEYLGHTRAGGLSERIEHLMDAILGQLEERCDVSAADSTTPERVKALRRRAIRALEELPEQDPGRRRHEHDLDDLFLVVQLFSYPGDYVSEHPSVERLAETLDKLEEDVLNAPTAGIRATRRATVRFGERIEVDTSTNRRQAGPALTRQLEQRVQALLDEIRAPANRAFDTPPAAAAHAAKC